MVRDFVDLYHRRGDLPKIRDFQVTTHDKPLDETAQEVIEKAGWHKTQSEAVEAEEPRCRPAYRFVVPQLGRWGRSGV
jgi:hypothetical protein